MLVSKLIENYGEEDVRKKILAGFQALTPAANFVFNLDKRNRIKFNTKFNEFCTTTYGLLFIR